MTIAHISNNELGFDVRTKLNALIDLAGGAVAPFTAGSVLFADSSGNIGQDNANFFWDATNNSLSLSGSRAMFKVASGGGDNWFMANAGNFTLAGSGGASNIGIGEITLQSLTSGSFNFALGSFSLQDLQTGDNNVALGTQVMSLNVAGSRNVGIGRAALDEQLNSDAVAVGDNALGNYDGWGSIGIGTQAAFNMSAGTKNIFIGYQCGSATSSTVNRNVWLGGYSGFGGNLSDTIVIANGDGSIMPANFSLTTSNVWSMANYATPVGLHVYNTADHVRGIGLTDWERAVFDWRVASNVLTIGTQAGGAGVLRPVNIVGSALTFNGSPIGGGGGSMAIGGSITSATAGSVLFAGASGVLAQDNANFFWDATNKALKLGVGYTYYIGALPALYVVPNALGDNWFEGDSGNTTMTGYNNFGTGHLSLAGLTTGFNNTAVGNRCMQYMTSGNTNFAFGTSALATLTSGSSNVAIGPGNLQNGQTIVGNVAIGANVMGSLGNIYLGGGAEQNNVAIGSNAFGALTTSSGCTAIGTYAGYNVVDGYRSTFIGVGAAQSASGSSYYNTVVGAYAGVSVSPTMTACTLLGMWAGPAASMYNVIALSDGNGALKADYGYSNSGWTFVGSPKAGAPAAGDLSSGSFAVIDDTSGGATWLVFNKAGTIRKVQLT